MEKMKLFLAGFLLFCLIGTGGASANEDSRRVFDYGELLSGTEREELEQQCLELEDTLRTELYILTTNDAEGKTSTAYADDFGDTHAFGYEKDYGTYIIFLIDMDNRNAWISTSGNAISHFSEARIDSTLDDVFEYLPEGDYYNSCKAFLKAAEKWMQKEPDTNPAETDPNQYKDTIYVYDEDGSFLDSFWIRLGISLLIGGVVTGIMMYHADSRMSANGRTYSKNGACKLNNRADLFLRTTTTSRKIETNSGGSHTGSGGGSHTSSGGHSHGGGGRSF